MAWRQGPQGSKQHLALAASATRTRTQRPRKYLAIHAAELVVEPNFQVLRRHCRSLLLRLEHAHRSAVENHVHRPPRLGSRRSLNLRIGIRPCWSHGVRTQGHSNPRLWPRAKRSQQHARWSRRISLRDGARSRLWGNRGLHKFVPTQQVRRGCQGAIVATMDWLHPLSGFVVGAIVGLTGMGGGSLMTPLLILLFGVHPLTAVGLHAAVTKTAGTAIHSKKGN